MAKGVGVRTAETIASCVYGKITDGKRNALSFGEFEKLLWDIGPVFVKIAVGSSQGKGCFLARFRKGYDEISGLSVAEVERKIGSDNWIMQEYLQCHPLIRDIYAGCVNTFRIATYRWHDEIRVLPVVMRMGSSSSFREYVDNMKSGGFCIGVQANGDLEGCGFSDQGKKLLCHPDTKIQFKNYRIEGMRQMVLSAVKMHTAIPQIGSVNWDFTLDKDGTSVLVEANCFSGGIVDMAQVAYGKALFGEDTAEILQWVALMRRLSFSERRRHLFGRM